jgi:hypothetical protein
VVKELSIGTYTIVTELQADGGVYILRSFTYR